MSDLVLNVPLKFDTNQNKTWLWFQAKSSFCDMNPITGKKEQRKTKKPIHGTKNNTVLKSKVLLTPSQILAKYRVALR